MEDFSEQQIKMLKTVVQQVVKDEIRINNDILFQEIKASEHRVKTELRAQLHQVVGQAKHETIEAVAEMINGSLVPQLDDHEQRLTKLETNPA